jgi:hypothetical protein
MIQARDKDLVTYRGKLFPLLQVLAFQVALEIS